MITYCFNNSLQLSANNYWVAISQNNRTLFMGAASNTSTFTNCTEMIYSGVGLPSNWTTGEFCPSGMFAMMVNISCLPPPTTTTTLALTTTTLAPTTTTTTKGKTSTKKLAQTSSFFATLVFYYIIGAIVLCCCIIIICAIGGFFFHRHRSKTVFKPHIPTTVNQLELEDNTQHANPYASPPRDLIDSE